MKTLILFGFAFALSGCTTAVHIGDAENTWYAVNGAGSPQLWYCMANKTDKKALPVCVEPSFVRRFNVHQTINE